MRQNSAEALCIMSFTILVFYLCAHVRVLPIERERLRLYDFCVSNTFKKGEKRWIEKNLKYSSLLQSETVDIKIHSLIRTDSF